MCLKRSIALSCNFHFDPVFFITIHLLLTYQKHEVFDFSLLVIASYTVFAQDGTSVTGYTTTIVIPGSPPAGAGTAHSDTENTGTVHTTEHLTGTEETHTTGATPETTTIVAPTTTHENTTTHETSVENTATVHHNTTTLHHNTTTIHPNATGTETHTETGTGTLTVTGTEGPALTTTTVAEAFSLAAGASLGYLVALLFL